MQRSKKKRWMSQCAQIVIVALLNQMPWAAGLRPKPVVRIEALLRWIIDTALVPSTANAQTPEPVQIGCQNDPHPDDPLLKCTPDADTTDPYVVAKAQELGCGPGATACDPQRLIEFVQGQIGYVVYKGSLRGARGTLWGEIGNGLDKSNLLVALLRASGIPARWVEGTIDEAAAASLIRSMFPPLSRVIGCPSPDDLRKDPAADPRLLSEASDHFWVEYGAGMQTVNPSATGGQPGIASGVRKFDAVPSDLQFRITLGLRTENTQPFLPGLAIKRIHLATFRTVELAGRPVALGHFVSASAGGLITYSPYLAIMRDYESAERQDIIRGESDYQELFSPILALAQTALVGVFLETSFAGPGEDGRIIDRPLVDRGGYAIRQSGGTIPDLDVGNPPTSAFSPAEFFAISTESGPVPSGVFDQLQAGMRRNEADRLRILAGGAPSPRSSAEGELVSLIVEYQRLVSEMVALRYAATASGLARDTATGMRIQAYASAPQLTLASSRVDRSRSASVPRLRLDAVRDRLATVVGPEQPERARGLFLLLRRLLAVGLESEIVGSLAGDASAQPASALQVMSLAAQRGVPLQLVEPSGQASLDGTAAPPDALVRMREALRDGRVVVSPRSAIRVGEEFHFAWFEYDGRTGEWTDVLPDGGHAAAIDYNLILLSVSGALVAEVLVHRDLHLEALCGDEECRRKAKLRMIYAMNGEATFITVAAALINPLVAGLMTVVAFLAAYFVSDDPPDQGLLLVRDHAPPPSAGDGEIVPDQLLTVLTGSLSAKNAYRLILRNATASDSAVDLGDGGSQGGLRIQTSVERVVVPAGGVAEVGVCVSSHPPDVPSVGQAFTVVVDSSDDTGQVRHLGAEFRFPAAHGVELSANRRSIYLEAGAAAGIAVTIKAIGNTPEMVRLSARMPPGVEMGGLPSDVALNPGEEITLPLSIEGRPGDGGTDGFVQVVADLCGDSAGSCTVAEPHTRSLTMAVRVRSAERRVIEEAAQCAEEEPSMVGALEQLGGAISFLQAQPQSEAVCAEVGVRLRALLELVRQGTAPLQCLADVAKLDLTPSGCAIDQFGELVIHAEHAFTAAVDRKVEEIQSGEFAEVAVTLTSAGTATTTVQLNLPTPPPGLSLSGDSSPVLLDPGATVTRTFTVASALDTPSPTIFPFEVRGVAQEAPVVQRTAVVQIAVRSAIADVVEVSVSPKIAKPGESVSIATSIMNEANLPRDVRICVSAEGESTCRADVAAKLLPATGPVQFDLGRIDTTDLPAGFHSLRVQLRNANGTPILGRGGEAPLYVGVPVRAEARAVPVVVPPGDSSVKTAIEVVTEGGNSARQHRTVSGDLSILALVDARASSSYQTQAPDLAVDGKATTYWQVGSQANTAHAGDPPYLDVEFAVDSAVQSIRAVGGNASHHFSSGVFQCFGADGALIAESPEVPFVAAGYTASFAFPEIVAGVRRIRFLSASDVGQPFLYELEVTGTTEVPSIRLPELRWSWSGSAALSTSKYVGMTPLVIDMNADGAPDVVFVSAVGFDHFGSPGVNGSLRALDGRDGHELFTVTDPESLLYSAGHVAAGDIDGDGLPEVVGFSAKGEVIAFENDGAVKWRTKSPEGFDFAPGPSIADLDGDGTPEIVVGRIVFNSSGTLRWRGTGGSGLAYDGAYSVVADLDLDGHPEVVAGNTAYRADGSILWRRTDLPDGAVAIGNLNEDPYPEIVLMSQPELVMLNHDGTTAWGPILPDTRIASSNSGAQPLLADVDGDGKPEIVIAGTTKLGVFNRDGTVRWEKTIRDTNSGVCPVAAFDFDGDGAAELIHRDMDRVRILSGEGLLLFEYATPSGTLTEYAAIADVDGDRHADLVVPSSVGAGPYLLMFSGADGGWPEARPIWNEHAYHVSNVNEDGSIPPREEPHWLSPATNGFRMSALGKGDGLDAWAAVTHRVSSGYEFAPAGVVPTPAATSLDQVGWAESRLRVREPLGLSIEGVVLGIKPGEVRAIGEGTDVDVRLGVGPNAISTTVHLPPVVVAARSLLGIEPASQVVGPGGKVQFILTLSNPFDEAESFELKTLKVVGTAVALTTDVVVDPGSAIEIPIEVSVADAASEGSELLTVVAEPARGGSQTVSAELKIRGEALIPAPRGLHLTIAPDQLTAGQGVPSGRPGDRGVTRYRARITNLGDRAEQVTLQAELPEGFNAGFAESTVEVLPGLGASREVEFDVTPARGISPGVYSFTVEATAAGEPPILDRDEGSVRVVGAGVNVLFDPPTGSPGAPFHLVVTNTGLLRDTINLSLAGPAASAAILRATAVTLEPGDSTPVAVDVDQLEMALAGGLNLIGIGSSESEPDVVDTDVASVTVASHLDVTGSFDDTCVGADAAGHVEALFQVMNLSNVEDVYDIEVAATAGAVSAGLIGFDGQAVNSLHGVRLPPLSAGAVPVAASVSSGRAGSITVRIRSQSDPATAAAATISVGACGGELCGNGVLDEGEFCDPGLPDSVCREGEYCAAAGTPAKCTCQPVAVESCGDCLDNDGNGLTDLEDPVCCAGEQPFGMRVKKASILRKRDGSTNLRFSAKAESGDILGSGTEQDVLFQMRNTQGELLCAKLPSSSLTRKGNVLRFKDPKGLIGSASGIRKMMFVLKKNGTARLSLGGKGARLTVPQGGQIEANFGFLDPLRPEERNQCLRAASALRAVRSGLRYP